MLDILGHRGGFCGLLHHSLCLFLTLDLQRLIPKKRPYFCLVAMPPPVKPPNSGYPKLILLISRQTTDRENKNQDVIQSIINASNLGDVETIDGADPANKQQRDDLFKISGLSSQYPQM